MERQFAKDGAKISTEDYNYTYEEHCGTRAKIAETVQRGGNASSMEREVRAWQETIRVAQKILEGTGE